MSTETAPDISAGERGQRFRRALHSRIGSGEITEQQWGDCRRRHEYKRRRVLCTAAAQLAGCAIAMAIL